MNRQLLKPLLLVSLLCILMPSNAVAGTFEDIGFTQLQDELGNLVPTGAGVSVAQSEAQFLTEDAYYPDNNISNPTNAIFENTLFSAVSGSHGYSSHAENVGRNFYSTQSLAPGITDVNLFTAGGWLNGDLLQTPQLAIPHSVNARVANHSWVLPGALSTMRKMDWVVNTDDFIQVVGVNNNPNNDNPGIKDGLTGAMNVIAVGLLSGRHESGTTNVPSLGGNSPYTDGRVRPHLVVGTNGESDKTSFSTPIVAAAATLLIETGRNPTLSNGTIQSSVDRENYTLYHAETSEVIRSALMAGANRNAAFTIEMVPHTYARTSSNGLDSHFGAGELNIYNSYHILAAGEQDNREDGNLADVKIYGFDYDTISNGAITPAEKKTYQFTINEGTPREFAATLSWNLQFTNVRVDSTRLDNLDLQLYQLGANDSRSLVQSSTDTNDTTENLYIADLGPGTYELVVDGENLNNVTLDYGLSWRFMADNALMGDVDLDGKVGLSDLLLLKKNLNASQSVVWTDGDLDGNGIVDSDDLSLLLSNYGKVGLDVASAPQLDATAVPEPSTIMLCILAIATLGIVRLKNARLRRTQ